jgi:amino acid adenylation domain-containing protein
LRAELPPDEKRALLAELLRTHDEERRTYPLSFSQQRLWFLDQLAPGNTYYNIHLPIPINAAVDVPVLERALNELVRRHEVLRTTFAAEDGQPRQLVSRELTLRLPLVDLAPLPPSEREAEAGRIAVEAVQRPFDLAAGPLLRVMLLRLQPTEHSLLVTVHHIACDGWSIGVFIRELTAIYGAYLAARPSPLAELPLQYGDFAAWQREWLRGDVLERQLSYWREQLADLPPLQLPTDRPRPAVQSHRGAFRGFALPGALVPRLRELAHQEGATLFMALLAAFKALLARYSGQDDFAVGTYIANRNRAEIEGLIGFFVNTLVLRTDLGGDPTFRDLVRRVRETALAAYAHQDVPFEMLVDDLQPERDLSRNPLFQVVFQLLSAAQLLSADALPQQEQPGDGRLTEVQLGIAAFDMAITLWEAGDTAVGQIEYSTDLFDDDTIARMLRHFEVLLEGIADDPDRRISELPLLTSEDVDQLRAWNDTACPYAVDRAITQLLEERASQTSGAPAFLYDGQTIVYGDLNRRANQLAHHLQALGVGSGVLVGVCLNRSVEAVVAILGVLKAGGAYLPLDPRYPLARLRFMLDDARVAVLVTDETHASGFDFDGAVVRVDSDRPSIEERAGSNPASRADPEQLAYAIYTSGSTGTPKGVAVNHRQILNRLAWMWSEYPFSEHEVCSQKTALSFVDSIWELFGGLLQGVPTVIVPDDALVEPEALVRTLHGHDVTRIWVVPSLLRALLDAHPDLELRLPTLTFWVTTGEPLSSELYERFAERMPHATLYNVYGTSEFWDATWWDPTREPAPKGRVPIGRPIWNMQAYALDRRGRPVPIGVPGELHIGGHGLPRGYIGRPDLTAEKLVPDPLARAPGAHVWRSGDVVRFLADGNIELLERLDNQIKLRGFRIEPSEIEVILRRHPAVEQATVVLSGDAEQEDARLVTYLVTRRDSETSGPELRSFLQGTLPAHMIPAAFVFLEELPLTPSGKVDRARLPDPRQATQGSSETVAPRNAVEGVLVTIWADLLGVPSVGVEENFFNDLGGHSLLGTTLVSRVRDAFDVELPLRHLFDAPTVAAMAEALADEASDPAALERTAQLLLRVAALSDEDVQTMLAERVPRQPPVS